MASWQFVGSQRVAEVTLAYGLICTWMNNTRTHSAGQTGMTADVRVEDVTPDNAGQITIRLTAAAPNDAIVQAVEIE
jgi:hypothetical protein